MMSHHQTRRSKPFPECHSRPQLRARGGGIGSSLGNSLCPLLIASKSGDTRTIGTRPAVGIGVGWGHVSIIIRPAWAYAPLTVEELRSVNVCRYEDQND